MRVLLYPDGEHKRYKIAMIKPYLEESGVDIITDPSDDFDVVFYQSYHKTYRRHDEVMMQLAIKYDVINIGCEDIRKRKNEEIMKNAFGYNSLAVPGDKFILEKSEFQGRHEMKLVKRIGARKDYIYVRLLDNRISDTHVRDYRIFIFDYKIRGVMTKDKPLSDRYGGAINADVQWVNNPFTDDQIAKIEKYCRLYKTHYTELDAVIEKGQLYIVDNNNVPSYNPAMKLIFEADNKKYLKYLSGCFMEMLKNHQS